MSHSSARGPTTWSSVKPAEPAEIIDLIYFVTHRELQEVKKFIQFLEAILEEKQFQEALEAKHSETTG